MAVATAQAQAEAAREAKDTALAGLALERERLRALEEAITKEREAWTRERAGISPRQSSSDA